MMHSDYAPPVPVLPFFQANLEAVNLGIPLWRKQVEQMIDDYIAQGGSVRTSVYLRSNAVDEILSVLFNHFGLQEFVENPIAMFAVGGYGRQEMLPFSDVDIMLLTAKPLLDDQIEKVQEFIAKMWDIGLEAGTSVRSISDCSEQVEDITVATALIEARLIAGDSNLSRVPKQVINEKWSPQAFYDAKIQEQIARHRKHNSTEYNLEPDIKNAPGALRDVHHIGWICKRYFRVNQLSDLVHQSFMTFSEYEELITAEDFLLEVRHHLHRVAGRSENKLLFDYQRKVAKRMGYDDLPEDAHPNAGIEAMMRVYYRKAMRISTLNEMMVANYYESLIESRSGEEPVEELLNDRFKIKNGAIAVTHSKVFNESPSALIEMFVLMGKHGVKDVRAKTMRLLKSSAPSIDDSFRNDTENQQLFLQMMANSNYLFHCLRKMKRFGVLGNYLPAFEKITGLMQYDLFHRYTVDAHTLLLIRVFHRFTDTEKYGDTFATVGGIYERMERKNVIHLAALFHDIAKGRGGDHSELGAVDAYEFCKANGLSEHDTNLIAWLVEHHLLMSLTAQKQDISDPDVVREFAEKMGDMVHLNHLYVLTVADMNATNPEIWNSWRSSLMRQLYHGARRMLRAGLDVPIDRDELISSTKEKARGLLSDEDNLADIENMWDELGDEYFLREQAHDIVWHTREILQHQKGHTPHKPLVIIREHQELALDAVQVFVYAKDMPNLFASTVSVFSKMNLDVQDARIITATRDFALDSYVLIDPHGTLLTDEQRQKALVNEITRKLQDVSIPKINTQRMPRQLKHFNVPTKIRAYPHEQGYHNFVIDALDQPGMLAMIACVFAKHHIEVHGARITTLGERAQDVFMITDSKDKLLSENMLTLLKDEITDVLDNG